MTRRSAYRLRGAFLSELLVTRPSEGGQVFATEIASHLESTHDFAVWGPTHGTDTGRAAIRPRWLGLALLWEVAKQRPDHVVYMPQSGLTRAAIARLGLLRLVVPGTRLSVVITQTHDSGTTPRALRVLKRLISSAVAATNMQHNLLDVAGIPTHLLGIRVAPSKISAKSRHEAREALGLPQDEPIYLHVGHGRHGRGLHLLKGIAPPGRLILVLSSTFPEESGAVPDDQGFDVRRGHIENLSDYYRAADVYVFPTTSAASVIGVPMSIVEALANGTPAVAIRSEVTQRLEHLDGLTLCAGPEALPDAARALISTHVQAEPTSIVGPSECGGDLWICRNHPSEERS